MDETGEEERAGQFNHRHGGGGVGDVLGNILVERSSEKLHSLFLSPVKKVFLIA